MLKNLSQFALQIESKMFQFAGEIDATLPQWEQAALELLKYLAQIKSQQAQAAQAAQQAAPPAEDKQPPEVVD